MCPHPLRTRTLPTRPSRHASLFSLTQSVSSTPDRVRPRSPSFSRLASPPRPPPRRVRRLPSTLHRVSPLHHRSFARARSRNPPTSSIPSPVAHRSPLHRSPPSPPSPPSVPPFSPSQPFASSLAPPRVTPSPPPPSPSPPSSPTFARDGPGPSHRPPRAARSPQVSRSFVFTSPGPGRWTGLNTRSARTSAGGCPGGFREVVGGM